MCVYVFILWHTTPLIHKTSACENKRTMKPMMVFDTHDLDVEDDIEQGQEQEQAVVGANSNNTNGSTSCCGITKISSGISDSNGNKATTFQEAVEAGLPPQLPPTQQGRAQAYSQNPSSSPSSSSSSSQQHHEPQQQKLSTPMKQRSSAAAKKSSNRTTTIRQTTNRVPPITSTEICDDDDDYSGGGGGGGDKYDDESSGDGHRKGEQAARAAAGGDTAGSVTSSKASSGTVAVVVDWAQRHSTAILLAVVLCLGVATSAAFLAIGLTGVFNDQQKEFERSAQTTVTTLQTKFEDYEDAASLIHARCRHYRGSSGIHSNWDRPDFRELYEYIIDTGLQFKAMQFDPNITNEERPAAEEEARQFYEEYYPHVNYRGFVGFNTLDSTSLEPRTEQPWYFPIHYQEPVVGNEAAIDLDYYSSESRIRAVNALFENKQPSMTDRLSLVKEKGQVSRCGDHDGPSFGIVLMHPGIELSDALTDGSILNTTDRYPDQWPRDFSSIVLCVPDLLNRTTIQSDRKFRVYIHDRSHPYDDEVFMGAAQKDGENIKFLDEIGLDELITGTCDDEKCFTEDVLVANREWTVTIVDDEPMPTSTIVVVVIGSIIILCASVLLAIWVRTNQRKQVQMNEIRAQAEAEKSLLILQNARQAAKTERELNDFIAHEGMKDVGCRKLLLDEELLGTHI